MPNKVVGGMQDDRPKRLGWVAPPELAKVSGQIFLAWDMYAAVVACAAGAVTKFVAHPLLEVGGRHRDSADPGGGDCAGGAGRSLVAPGGG